MLYFNKSSLSGRVQFEFDIVPTQLQAFVAEKGSKELHFENFKTNVYVMHLLNII